MKMPTIADADKNYLTDSFTGSNVTLQRSDETLQSYLYGSSQPKVRRCLHNGRLMIKELHRQLDELIKETPKEVMAEVLDCLDNGVGVSTPQATKVLEDANRIWLAIYYVKGKMGSADHYGREVGIIENARTKTPYFDMAQQVFGR